MGMGDGGMGGWGDGGDDAVTSLEVVEALLCVAISCAACVSWSV